MTSSQNPVTPASKLSPNPPQPPSSLLVDTPYNSEMVSPLLIARYMAAQQLHHYANDSEDAKWHNNLSYEEWDNWRKAAIKQFVPYKAKPLKQLCSIKLSLLVKKMLDEKNEDLNEDEAEAANPGCSTFYLRLIPLPGRPQYLEDAYNYILTQYQDCVEDEPEELEHTKSE
ncbi:hypothetical protein DSO57_1024338 [Entomophthora muscae]|uniref:Uncharacterized protein n=1 Tax=Entomophthora muscae TaxID=34485 RepID=A0ACC2TDW1_9FUNG|nr:hypothetical protein DSO57_1024338 [Entomophthora muscae]